MKLRIQLPPKYQTKLVQIDPETEYSGDAAEYPWLDVDVEHAKRVIQEYITDMRTFMEDHRFLTDFHGAEFFVKTKWNGQFHHEGKGICGTVPGLNDDRASDIFPEDWRKVFDQKEQWGFQDLIDLVQYGKFPQGVVFPEDNLLLKFLKDLKVLAMPREQMKEYGHEDEFIRSKMTNFDFGMSLKKKHEIDNFGCAIDDLLPLDECPKLYDIGAGQGYLSSLLSFGYGYDVTAVDFDPVQINGTARRIERLKLSEASNENVDDNAAVNENAELIRTVQCYIKSPEDIKRIVDIYHENSGLVGLHICGNLVPCTLKAFMESDSIKSISVVGCCYNLLTESSEIAEECCHGEGFIGFPLSKYLHGFKMGQTARGLSSQALQRWGTSQPIEEFELVARKHFYRAVYQAVLFISGKLDYGIRTHVAMRKLKNSRYYGDFFTYFNKIHTYMYKRDELISDEEIKQVYDAFDGKGKQRLIYYMTLRVATSKVSESLLLADRILYLLEEYDVKKDFSLQVLPIFDPIVSPRNMCFVLRKA